MEHRQTPRFRVQFRSTFSAPCVVGGEGHLVDLSLGGCRVDSDIAVPPGTELELRFYWPKEALPIAVEVAAVRWGRGREFGVEFLHLRAQEEDRLLTVIRDTEAEPPQ